MFFKKITTSRTQALFFININNKMGSTRVSLHRPDLLFAICLDKWSVIESTIYWGELDIYIALWKSFFVHFYLNIKKNTKTNKSKCCVQSHGYLHICNVIVRYFISGNNWEVVGVRECNSIATLWQKISKYLRQDS